MAALYLHNAVFIPDMTDSLRGHLPHSRTMSSGTLRTIATTNSHTTQPLLDSPTRPGHTAGLSFDGGTATLESKGFWEQRIRRRLRRLKLGQSVFESIMAVWAVYNTVRYFLAYKVYESSTGQAVSLVLGTLTALAFAFFSCATVISLFETRLVLHHIPIRIILTMSTAFRLLASFFLIVPAIVNLALTIVWRMSPDLDLSIRCHMDVDIVWSIVPQPCSGNPVGLGFYLGAAIIRTLITFLIIVAHYAFSSAYRVTRRPSLRRRRPNQSRRHRHRSRGSFTHSISGEPLTSASSPVSPPMTSSSNLPVSLPPRSLNPTLRHTSSARFLRSSNGAPSSPESDDEGGESGSTDTDVQGPLPATSTPALSEIEIQRFIDLQRFANRFRSLVAQAASETDDALVLPNANSDTRDIYTSLPPRRVMVHSNNWNYTDTDAADLEYGRRSDIEPTQVRILNTFVRRMPTIESLGSRERELSVSIRTASSRGSAALSHQQHYSPTSMYTSSSFGSRPSTKHGIEGPSRQSSVGPCSGARVGEEKIPEGGTACLLGKNSNSLRSSKSGSTAGSRRQRNGSAHSSASASVTESPPRTDSRFAFELGQEEEEERGSTSSSL